jgi:dTDP-4-dehydrorhamnose reductase
MKVLVTGTNGTVAPVVVERLAASGHGVVAWDRSRVSPDDPAAVRAFVARVSPDWIVHAATGSPDWAETLAAASGLPARLLYVSSASVFSGRGPAPIRTDAAPDAADDYGVYKAECERRVAAANADTLIVRIGWQIGDAPGGNTMLTYLAEAHARDGAIRASTRWFPACSFLRDTADAFLELMEREAAGVYHVDGNPGLSFFEIASRLNRLHETPWTVVPSDDFVFDNRMADDRVAVAPITLRLEGRES